MTPSFQEAVLIATGAPRFEVSRIGEVARPIHCADISSAYAAALTTLPCLLPQHGRWYHDSERRGLVSRIESAGLALVNCNVAESAAAREDWGPLPWRAPSGDIVFPRSGVSTWVWREEALAAIEHFGQVDPVTAWLRSTECSCRPFAALADLYRFRLAAAYGAKAIKGVLTAAYGKIAQTMGASPFQEPIYAGNVTSRTRAMLLSAFGIIRKPWGILQFATDSVFATSSLAALPALATGTDDLSRPLGGWEQKNIGGGVFIARPGLYFALDDSERASSDVRARGLSRADFARHAGRIRQHFAKTWQKDSDGAWFAPPYQISDAAPRFVGMRSATRQDEAGAFSRSDDFASWQSVPFAVGFDTAPKRAGGMRDGRLTLRSGRTRPPCRGMSAAYRPDMHSDMVVNARAARAVASEQPGGSE